MELEMSQNADAAIETKIREAAARLEARITELEQKMDTAEGAIIDEKLTDRVALSLQNAGFGAIELSALAVLLGQKVAGSDLGMGEMPLTALIAVLLTQNVKRVIPAMRHIIENIKLSRKSEYGKVLEEGMQT